MCLCAPQWCLLSTVLCANIVCTLCPEEKSCPTIVSLFEKKNTVTVRLRASPPTLSMWPCKNISHIQVLVTNFFPTPPIKLKLGLQVGGRLLITTHLDQTNYLANQKRGAVNYLAYHSSLTPIKFLREPAEKINLEQFAKILDNGMQFKPQDNWNLLVNLAQLETIVESLKYSDWGCRTLLQKINYSGKICWTWVLGAIVATPNNLKSIRKLFSHLEKPKMI